MQAHQVTVQGIIAGGPNRFVLAAATISVLAGRHMIVPHLAALFTRSKLLCSRSSALLVRSSSMCGWYSLV